MPPWGDASPGQAARGEFAFDVGTKGRGVADLALADAKPGTEDPFALVVHSVANTLIGRAALGIKDLGGKLN